MPSIHQSRPLAMVNDSGTNPYGYGYGMHTPDQQFTSATYTSSSHARPGRSGVGRNGIVRESMAQVAAETQQLPPPFYRRFEYDTALEQNEEEYLHSREYRPSSYSQAREQARFALDEMRRYREQEEAAQAQQHQSLQQPSSTRSARPAVQHRVYLINCKSCDSFLTDRGMRAVLLLRPHITLYSTDAVPNCGPLFPPSHPCEPADAKEPVVERTCNCLTQTLGCYGCGNAVGYHIVSPCARCTSSVSKHHKNSNGHRTVLHCAEIKVRERRYVPGEKGVVTASPEYELPASHRTGRGETSVYRNVPRRRQHTSQTDSRDHFDVEVVVETDENNKEVSSFDQAPPTSFIPSSSFSSSSSSPLSSSSSAATATAATEAKRGARVINRGDVVYWSDLVSSGERYEPIDSDEILSMPVAGR